jgi:hypothetical protein
VKSKPLVGDPGWSPPEILAESGKESPKGPSKVTEQGKEEAVEQRPFSTCYSVQREKFAAIELD